jgi:hypothetical protein
VHDDSVVDGVILPQPGDELRRVTVAALPAPERPDSHGKFCQPRIGRRIERNDLDGVPAAREDE